MANELDTPSSAPEARHLVALAAGGLLLLAFLGLSRTWPGLVIQYFPPFHNSSPGELQLWAALAFLLVPAGALLGYGAAPRMAEPLSRGLDRVARWRGRRLLLALAGGLLLYALLARLGHQVVLRDLPVTDDEYGASFGGRLLAQGRLWAPIPAPRDAWDLLLLYLRDGWMTSYDYLGVQLVWAAGFLLGAPAWLFALGAALPVVFLPLAAARLSGRGSAPFALLFFLACPMVTLLSATTHAHVVSRGVLVMVVWAWLRARDLDRTRDHALLGLLLGLAFLMRPPEATCLALPLLWPTFWGALRRDPAAMRRARPLLLASLGPLLVFFLHAHAVTGSPFLHPRMGPGRVLPDFVHATSLAERLAVNPGYNLFLLTVWVLGPLGLPLAVAGAARSGVARRLLAGVGLLLLLGVVHDDTGIHAVGPIHYSEAAAWLCLVAAAGWRGIEAWLRRYRVPRAMPRLVLVGMLLGMLPFTLVNAVALRDQAAIQA